MDSQTLTIVTSPQISQNDPFRVRALIAQLSYPELLRGSVIPDLEVCTPSIVTKRYPPWVYNLNRSGYTDIFCQFGLYVEEIVYWAITRSDEPDYLDLWGKICDIPIPANDLTKSRNFFGGIVTTFRTAFSGHSSVQHGPDLTYKTVQGHPDLVGPNWILDVKTTSGFSKMAKASFLQILAYGMLAKTLKMNINAIGILLPLQRQFLWYDISQWNPSAYRNVLLRESRWVRHDLVLYDPELLLSEVSSKVDQAILAPNIMGGLGCLVSSPYTGSHVRKDSDYPTTVPFQIFLASPQAEGYVSAAELEIIRQKSHPDQQLYVHAPYIINLCNGDSWPVERLRHELSACKQIGGKGVVVHVGKHKSMTYEQGLNMMEQRLRVVLNEATVECPLLLETPAGEGTELCASITSMMNFFARFEGHPGFKLCVDSAHVWGAGYEPGYYMRQWLQKYPGTIGLVHFNDSRKKRGSRADGHYYAGLGYIGFPRMWEVHELCIKEKIPMVTE